MKVAVLDDYQSVAESLADWSQLPPGTEVTFFSDHLTSEDALADRLAGFDVVMGMRERTPFPRSLLERLPDLRLLVTTGRRNASFDIEGATGLGIAVCGTNGAGEGPTELTWGLILGIVRQIPLEDRLSREGKWGTTVGVGLKGKTIGLLGLGHIGSLVARVASAFDMNIIAWSQNLTAERARECGATLVDKDTLFRESDILSVHLVLSQRTRGLVGAHELALMKPTAYLINISRGPIVDEDALVDVSATQGHRRGRAGHLRRGAVAGRPPAAATGQHPHLPPLGLRNRRLVQSDVRRSHRGHPRLRQRRAGQDDQRGSADRPAVPGLPVDRHFPLPFRERVRMRVKSPGIKVVSKQLTLSPQNQEKHAMKAVRINEFGGLDVLKWEEAPDPEPRPHQVLIKVDSAGVNYADLMRRGGNYPGPDLPSSMGLEASRGFGRRFGVAGTVVEVGSEVTGVSVGQRVMAMGPGGQAEIGGGQR